MNDTMKIIFDKIKEYNRIIISRHQRPDGDAVGSTLGLREILRLTYPEKEIYVSNEDYAEYTKFLGEEDGELDDAMYNDALVIVIDTGNVERISNKKYTLGKELIKIDHHIDIAPYGDVSWVEEERSSACEMIAAFYIAFRDELKISKRAAELIYAGMVTDSGRFKYDVSGETLRCAAALVDVGIDTETLYANLYLDDFDCLKFNAFVYRRMKITENGVAYIHITRGDRRRYGISTEQASNFVSLLSSIRGSIAWLAFIDYDDGSTRVRLRSRFVHINGIAEKYSGGGHACASGATVHGKKEMRALISDTDALVAEYKKNNEGVI